MLAAWVKLPNWNLNTSNSQDAKDTNAKYVASLNWEYRVQVTIGEAVEHVQKQKVTKLLLVATIYLALMLLDTNRILVWLQGNCLWDKYFWYLVEVWFPKQAS